MNINEEGALFSPLSIGHLKGQPKLLYGKQLLQTDEHYLFKTVTLQNITPPQKRGGS